MIGYVDLRDALVAQLAEVDDVHVYDHYPPTITPTAAVVEFPDRIEYGTTMCLETFAPVVRLFVARSREGESALFDLLAHDNVPALVAKVNGVVVREARNFGAVNVGGADLYTAELVLSAIG